MNVRFELEGFDQFRRMLDRLPAAAQQRVVNPSLRSGARVIADATKAAAPIGERGNLKRAGGFIRVSRNGADNGPFRRALRIGFRARGGSHALLVDKGTGERKTKTGASRGRSPARLFFDRAVAASQARVIALLRANFGVRLAVEARRLAGGELTSRGTLLSGARR